MIFSSLHLSAEEFTCGEEEEEEEEGGGPELITAIQIAPDKSNKSNKQTNKQTNKQINKQTKGQKTINDECFGEYDSWRELLENSFINARCREVDQLMIRTRPIV